MTGPVVKLLGLTAAGIRWITLRQTDVGLDKVENLAPVDYPVSEAANEALNILSQSINTQQGGKLGLPGAPVVRPLLFGTLYQATTKTKPAFISLNVETTYEVTLAGVMEDIVEIRVGPEADKTKLVDGSGGTVVPSFRTSLKGLIVTVGTIQVQRSQMIIMLPVGWYFAVRRVTGTRAVISSATDQSFG